MSDNQTDVSCEGCGETFTNFLQEMADQNAKVTTCPKCGKIHPLTPPRPAVTGQAPEQEQALRKTS